MECTNENKLLDKYSLNNTSSCVITEVKHLELNQSLDG